VGSRGRVATGRGAQCGVLGALALSVLVVFGTVALPGSVASAAPKTLRGATYSLMQGFMSRWDNDGFAKVTDLGALAKYRARLAGCTIRVDPALRSADGSTPNAQYGPEPDVITFSKDPRTLPASARNAWGQTVWHEVTHALEESNGDDPSNGDKLYQERNIEYMGCVATEALPWLDQLERKAKAGGSVKQLHDIWQKYLDAMNYAATKLPETQKYPPDLALMQKWFGFSVDTQTITRLYVSNKAFSGPVWKNLRTMLAQFELGWTGVWLGYDGFSGIRFTQTGGSVSGRWDAPDGAFATLKGTVVGSTLSGDLAHHLAGGTLWFGYTFSITLAADGASFSGQKTCVTENGEPIPGDPHPQQWDARRDNGTGAPSTSVRREPSGSGRRLLVAQF